MGRRLLSVVSCLSAAFVCAYAFYTRFWVYRDCIAEAASSCVNPDGTNLIAGGALWGVLAAAWLAAAVYQGARR
jgi:hypothetical protein